MLKSYDLTPLLADELSKKYPDYNKVNELQARIAELRALEIHAEQQIQKRKRKYGLIAVLSLISIFLGIVFYG